MCSYKAILRNRIGSCPPLQGIHNIHSSDGLPLGMLGVGDSIPDDILQEDLEDAPSFLVDESTDPLDTTPPCKSPDSRLGDTLDVIPQHLAMSLGTSLTQAFASFASSSHGQRQSGDTNFIKDPM